ncbi:CMGC/CDKL protein kinase [Spizellomyces punctatus DAOM BR117]|uniref:cyclin-dependent kinase n=1 Tax=Spizellomyces punctatus (strain DAOM BR117) TaxID=645134 RepID=A0A0L0HCV0_SPIPD|nr:CMGC/CDKL protein kinase [Spizellomyces punctatus DAOM BR117]KNC98816.1 CMGC/CDKL protein kinase [Spizellomyces punctatus DAOM BR117]|eukprot:XP_016606856.1 CMGC/CDKL protein kinase [Spizellomyces punctatus DAOM BR117]
MEYYEKVGPIGEGTYGVVMKCRHKETGQIVAIKKFKESEDDLQIRKTALREVRMLKQLKNDNIVNLIEVFRRKGKLYLVFEHLDHTILEDLDKRPHGLSDDRENGTVRKVMWQLLKATDYLHSHNVIHRDIKPENILVSVNGVVKLCDFGFARTLAGPGAKYTDYVATRWYRAPELLVGDTEYGKAVDVWATGCIFAEILTGQPLFPGDTDIDQLYRIMKCLGPLTKRHMEVFLKNPLFVGVRIPEIGRTTPIESKLPNVAPDAMGWLRQCLIYDSDQRATTRQLMSHPYFQSDGFADRFEIELRQLIDMDKEREQADRVRRRKPKKQGQHYDNRNLVSRKDARQPLEDLESNAKRHADDDRQYTVSSIPPIHGAQSYSKQSYYATSTTTGPTSNYGGGNVGGAGGHREVMSRDGSMGFGLGLGGFGGLPPVAKKKVASQAISFPKIQAGYGVGGTGLMRGNVSPSPGPGLGGMQTHGYGERGTGGDD